MIEKKTASRIAVSIVDQKVDDETNSVLFKVRWNDYPLSEDTWMPIFDIDNLDSLKIEKSAKKIETNVDKGEEKVEEKPKSFKRSRIIEEDNDEDKEEDVDINSNTDNLTITQKEVEVEAEGKNEAEKAKEEKNDIKDKSKSKDNKKVGRALRKGKPLFKIKEKGNIQIDIPLTIRTGKLDSVNKQVLCEIEWKQKENGTTLLNSWYTNTEIKTKYPKLLLEYYEKHLKFPDQKKE